MKIALILLLFTTAAIAQDYPNLLSSNVVTTISYFELGDERSYHVEKEHQEVKKDGKPEVKSAGSYDIHFKVISADDTSYTIEMRYSDIESPESKAAEQQFVKDILTIQEKIVIKYQTNELGQFLGIINAKEIAKELSAQMDVLEKELNKLAAKEAEKIKPIMDLFMANIRALILKPENIESLYAEDILMLHGYYGFEFTLDNTEHMEMEYYVLDDLAVQGEGKVVVRNISPASDLFTLSSTESPNKDDMNKYIKHIMEKMLVGFPDIKKENIDFKFDVNTKSTINFELSTGWVKKINSSSTTKVTVDGETVKVVEKVTYKSM